MADRSIRWKPYAVLVLSLCLTAAVTALTMRTIEARDQMRFRNAIASAQDRIDARLETYVSLLIGGRALFLASDRVTLDDFRAYVRSLDLEERYPGLQCIGFSKRIPKANERDEHLVVYLEPLDLRNAAAIGYDMSTDDVRRRAMARARDTGEPAVSGVVTPIREIDAEKPGFLIYLPVYRGRIVPSSIEERRTALLGFVYSPFRTDDLFAGIFGTEAQPRVGFSVYHGEDLSRENLLHRTDVPEESPRFQARRAMRIADRPWTIAFHSTEFFEDTSSGVLLHAIPTIGLVATSIVFLLMLSEARARAEAEAQRKNLHSLFMDAPAAIAILRGPELRYELSNPFNQELAQGRQLVGRTAREALPEFEGQGLYAKLVEAYQTGAPMIGREVPVTVPNPDGSMRQYYIDGVYRALRGGDGSIEGVMVFAYDVTEQVLARKRIESLAEDLKLAVRARDDFLSIAGHELNTPLAALRLQMDVLAARVDEPELIARFGKVQRQISRLERLVSELLDVSRITAGRLAIEREDVDLKALVREVTARFEEQAAKSGSTLVLHTNGEVVARCDRMRIDQVLTNLLSNALKYGAGKPVEISVGRAGELARLEVRDHGIGVDPSDSDRIFGRYERAVSHRNFGGFGLGLWISRQIVEAHGGAIRLESVPNMGSAFSVELPSGDRGERASQLGEGGEIVDVGGELWQQEELQRSARGEK